MLGKVNDGDWSVLVMDPEATRIMSAACRVSEILNYGVARASSCTAMNMLWLLGVLRGTYFLGRRQYPAKTSWHAAVLQAGVNVWTQITWFCPALGSHQQQAEPSLRHL